MAGQPLSVTELTRQVKDTVETGFPQVQVVGEISGMTRAGSGHLYFTMKDDNAQMRAVMWRSGAGRLRFDPHDGLEVVATGGVELYQPRGTLQLIVKSMQPLGIGALELAFRQLQEKLAAEGLFAPERKRPLPVLPRRIAMITSPTGAAVRDMLQVLSRRWPSLQIVLLPVAVQGATAASQIAAAFAEIPRLGDIDLVLTGRGGGSLEDLWAFNEEPVARAIAACPVPVVCAVGHEIDVSIADLVADRRALTPSEAAEIIVPDQQAVRNSLEQIENRMGSALNDQVRQLRRQLENLADRRVLSRPRDLLHDRTTRLDELGLRLHRATRQLVDHRREQISASAGRLEALSPLKVLGRGYSLTRVEGTRELLRNATNVAPGTLIETVLHEGRLVSRVEEVRGEQQDATGLKSED